MVFTLCAVSLVFSVTGIVARETILCAFGVLFALIACALAFGVVVV